MNWLDRIYKNRRLIGLMVLGWLFLLTTDVSKSISFMHKSDKEIRLAYTVFRAVSIWGWVDKAYTGTCSF